MKNMQEVLFHFKGVKKVGNGYMACCPAHDDHEPSLSIRLSDDGDKVLLHCFAGCEDEAILKSVGLTYADLFAESKPSRPKNKYNYYDTDGTLLYIKERYEYSDGTKSFGFKQPNGVCNLQGVKRVPYNLPAVIKAAKIYFVEGEKCADAINQKGFVATTLENGSGSKWRSEFGEYFRDKEIVILPDNDDPGRKYAEKIQKNLPWAVIKELPDLEEKEDIYDWLLKGHSMEEIDDLPEIAKRKDTVGTKENHLKKRRQSQVTILMDLLKSKDITIFKDENNEPFVEFPTGDHKERYPVNSKDAALWMQSIFYKKTNIAIRGDNLKDVINLLSAEAQFGDKVTCCKLSNRVAKHGNNFVYDLTNKSWSAITINTEGWKEIGNVPALFHRYNHQNPQVMPQKGGDLNKIFDFINLKDSKLLFLGWLVTCFVPDIPHPLTIIYGEKGAAKSTACILLKRIIDPSVLETLTLSKDERTIIVNLQNNYFLPFDNVSSISGNISDILCRAVTGDAVQQRKLYTNNEDCIFTFKRCLAINGINNVANRADLLDRSLLFELERISEDDRRETSKVNESFEKERPYLLGAVFDILVKAMQIYPSVKLDKLTRMADFCRWGFAVGEALGGYGEEFLKEYHENQNKQNQEAINSDIVASLTVEFLEDKLEWSGRVSDLYNELCDLARKKGINTNTKNFPGQPNALSRRYKGIKSNLNNMGIMIEWDYTDSQGSRIILKDENIAPVPSYHINPFKHEERDCDDLTNDCWDEDNGDNGVEF